MNSTSFYFPLLFLTPDFSEETIELPPFELVKRKWETSIFDLATLATKHKLHLPYQLMDVLLKQCNVELCIKNQSSLEEAQAYFQSFRLSLYATGVSAFLSPFITTHSINEYSGINLRDSNFRNDKAPPELQQGWKSGEVIVEAWPFELSLQCIVSRDGIKVSSSIFHEAAEKAKTWRKLVASSKSLEVVTDVANSAPKLTPLDQSILHIWSGLEALFPQVNTELSFKISLYLSQLIASGPDRLNYYEKVRDSYNLRSKITHGAQRGVGIEHWKQTWIVLMDAFNAIVSRGKMPQEKELLKELLS